jgi:hypothetical protein
VALATHQGDQSAACRDGQHTDPSSHLSVLANLLTVTSRSGPTQPIAELLCDWRAAWPVAGILQHGAQLVGMNVAGLKQTVTYGQWHSHRLISHASPDGLACCCWIVQLRAVGM